MKYLGTLVFVAALYWSWNAIHRFEDIPFETHANLQIKLSDLIKETVAQKRPTFENFHIVRIWTEQLEKNTVKASFIYRFTEKSADAATPAEVSESVVEGNAILKRVGTGFEDIDQWKLESVKTTNDEIAFSSGLVIGPNTEVPADATTTSTSTTTATATTTAVKAQTATATTTATATSTATEVK